MKQKIIQWSRQLQLPGGTRDYLWSVSTKNGSKSLQQLFFGVIEGKFVNYGIFNEIELTALASPRCDREDFAHGKLDTKVVIFDGNVLSFSAKFLFQKHSNEFR